MEKQKGLKNHIQNNHCCIDCGKKVRKLRVYKNKFLCYNCYRKNFNIINEGIYNNKKKLKDVLNKVYEIRGYLNKKGNIIGYRSFPSILIGHKIKIVLVENKK